MPVPIIYSQVSCRLLDRLGSRARKGFTTEESRARLFKDPSSASGILSTGRYKSAKGTSGDDHAVGWPPEWQMDGVLGNYLLEAIYEIAVDGYADCTEVLRVADDFLTGVGIEIPGLKDAACSLKGSNGNGFSLRDCSPENEDAFLDAVRLITNHCVVEYDRENDYGYARRSEEQARREAVVPDLVSRRHDKLFRVSPLGVVPAAILGMSCHITLFSGKTINWESDGYGAIGPQVDRLPEVLLKKLIPQRLLVRLVESTGATLATEVVFELLDPLSAGTLRPVVIDFFSHDGGKRFSTLVANCRSMTMPLALFDSVLLNNRLDVLYRQMSLQLSDESITDSRSIIRRYSERDSALTLAATTVNTMAGIEKPGLLRSILNGRWGKI